MLDKKDAQWWILEAEKHPDTAVDLIRMLADRLAFLDKQNEELRGELITLRRKLRGDTSDTDNPALRQRIQELETALRQGGTKQRLLIYAADRLEANAALGKLTEHGLERELPGDVAMLVCGAAATLLIVTDEAQVFSVPVTALPLAEGGSDGVPAMLGNPRNVAAILDQSAFERCRFLTLLSRDGYVYSVLAGSISQIVKRGDKLIRNLIPGDPIVAAIPSYNADLLALSEKGRVARFPEKAIAGSGSMALELPKGDSLVRLIALNADTNLLFLSADGKLFVRPSSGMARRQAPGTSTGMPFKGQSMFGVLASDEALILTGRGKLISVRAAELPYRAQTESGVAVPGLAADDSILAWTAKVF